MNAPPRNGKPPGRAPRPGGSSFPPVLLRRVLAMLLLVGIHVAGCRSASVGRTGEAPPAPEPTLTAGPPEPGATSTAAALLAEAREAFRAADHAGALDGARSVVEGYPRTPASVPALLLSIRAAVELERWEAAARWADRYRRVEGIDPADRVEATLLAARARARTGDSAGALRDLGELPPDLPPEAAGEALELARTHAPRLSGDALAGLARELPAAHPAGAPVLAEHALVRWFAGDTAGARVASERLLAADPPAEEAAVGRAILDGTVEELVERDAIVGSILPRSGDRFLQRYGSLLEEGIRLALEREARGTGGIPELEVADDRGDPGRAGTVIRRLEEEGALGVVGPLSEEGLRTAARARRTPIPLISPTARTLPEEEAVYTLMGPDTSGAVTMARVARRLGFERVAVMYPRTRRWTLQAEAFSRVFRAEGGVVTLEVPYDSATTTFTAPLERVAAVEPHAVFVPIPERDVPLVAPQVAFFGLDTLGVRVLGTGGWASRDVLREVDERYLTGVIAATPVVPGVEGSSPRTFIEAYEQAYRKTLRSRLPAYGYDAAGLLIHALRSGARTPHQVQTALEGLEGFEGATGTLRIRDGEIVRAQTVVVIQGGRAIPLSLGRSAEPGGR